MFASVAEEYYQYRFHLVRFLESSQDIFARISMLDLPLVVRYDTKVISETIRASITDYMARTQERDLMTGVTYI